jgi:hypothetical protein
VEALVAIELLLELEGLGADGVVRPVVDDRGPVAGGGRVVEVTGEAADVGRPEAYPLDGAEAGGAEAGQAHLLVLAHLQVRRGALVLEEVVVRRCHGRGRG